MAEMTDLEIDRRLALAIGWKKKDVFDSFGFVMVWCESIYAHQRFSHKDWNVIGPIAQAFNAFPHLGYSGKWRAEAFPPYGNGQYADCPQTAIAMAVIQQEGL